jgi:hypothetical protein
MKRTAFVPRVDACLEDRVVPTVHALATPLPPPTFGGGHIDYTIPYVFGTNVPEQNNLNFTSFTFHTIVTSTEKNFAAFNRTGNIAGLERGMKAVVRRVPFGPSQFGPTLVSDLSGLNSGNRDLSRTVENQVLNDLLIYLDNGIGQKFNIIKSSRQHFSTDVFLTYNVKG